MRYVQPLGVIAIVGSTMLFLLRAFSHIRGLNTDYVMFGRTENLFSFFSDLLLPFALVSTVCFVVAGGFGLVLSLQIIVFLARQRSRVNRTLDLTLHNNFDAFALYLFEAKANVLTVQIKSIASFQLP